MVYCKVRDEFVPYSCIAFQASKPTCCELMTWCHCWAANFCCLKLNYFATGRHITFSSPHTEESFCVLTCEYLLCVHTVKDFFHGFCIKLFIWDHQPMTHIHFISSIHFGSLPVVDSSHITQ